MTHSHSLHRRISVALAVTLGLVLIVGGISLVCLMGGIPVRHVVEHVDDVLCGVLPNVRDTQAATAAVDLLTSSLAGVVALAGLPLIAAARRSSGPRVAPIPAWSDPLSVRLLL
jgi:hypothetical protein